MQTYIQAGRHTYIQAYIQRDRVIIHTARPTVRVTYIHTYTHTGMHTYIPIQRDKCTSIHTTKISTHPNIPTDRNTSYIHTYNTSIHNGRLKATYRRKY